MFWVLVEWPTNFKIRSRSSFIEVIFQKGRLPFFQIFPIIFIYSRVVLQLLGSKFCPFPAISLLSLVAAQDMWWWQRRICGGGGAGYVVGEIKIKANSAQLELELGLSLAICDNNLQTIITPLMLLSQSKCMHTKLIVLSQHLATHRIFPQDDV